MQILEKDTHEARYLTIDQEGQYVELEMKLIESMDNHYILRPCRQNAGGEIIRFDISGLETIDAYLTNRKMDRSEMIGFLAQLKSVIRALEDHMLSDANILFEPQYVYIDKLTRKARFIPVCRTEGTFGNRLRPLIETVFCHADMDDTESLLFASKMMRTVLQNDLKMHMLMELADPAQLSGRREQRKRSDGNIRISNEFSSDPRGEVTMRLTDENGPVQMKFPEKEPETENEPSQGIKGFFSGFVSRFKEEDDEDE